MADHDKDREAALIALGELENAREAWEVFSDHWEAVAQGLDTIGAHAGVQVRAYKPFVRDQGMGDGPEAWFAKAEDALNDVYLGEDDPDLGPADLNREGDPAFNGAFGRGGQFG